MIAAVVVSTTVAVVGGLVLAYIPRPDPCSQNSHHDAYILENTVIHARLLPTPSKHAFSYPTLAFFVSLDALESHSLNLARGWLFGYGGTSWRVIGLRSTAYLIPDVEGKNNLNADNGRSQKKRTKTIKEKLREVLEEHGHDAEEMGDVWTLTMPSYMGYEGINPLSVHYCYVEDKLTWVVFEIHNTFGEKHVHVVTCGVDENDDCPPGFDHSWTFARDFHVSPFNDRLGHYVMSISAPPPPRAPTLASNPPRPKIRIHLHAASDSDSNSSSSTSAGSSPSQNAVGPLKLTANQAARRAIPLTSANLLGMLARYPFALFLSFVRILYHAWILHYVKRLDVFPRPDPKPAMHNWGRLPSSPSSSYPSEEVQGAPRAYGSVGWQDEGPLEAYSRRVIERFLARRANELNLRIRLISGDPSVPQHLFFPSYTAGSNDQDSEQQLVIYYKAARFFSTLLLAPSASHMLLLGRTEDLFHVNSEVVFAHVFVGPSSASPVSSTQRLRTYLLPPHFLATCANSESIPSQHPLDTDATFLNGLVIYAMHMADRLEKLTYGLAKARFVPGTEPWGRWDRAANVPLRK